MFAALEIKDNQHQLVRFFFFLFFSNSGPNVDLQVGTLDRTFAKFFELIPNGGVIIMVHKISRRHNNILMVTVHPRL